MTRWQDDKMRFCRRLWQWWSGAIGAAIAKPVLAHGLLPGRGLVAGLAHPVGGWDHLLAMVAVGILSAKMGGRAVWMLPLHFVLSMAVGYGAGLGGLSIPLTEWGILLSVVVLGGQVALSHRCDSGRLRSEYLIVLLFGLCHGYAHGLEWPQQTSALWFSLGFVVSTAGLHLIGVILGLLWLEGARPKWLFTLAGSGIAAAGLLLIALYWGQAGRAI